MARHELTTEERRKGALAAAETKRQRRVEARQAVSDRLAEAMLGALERVEQLIQSEDERVALRAARDLLDRALGRPTVAVALSGGEGPAIPVEYRGVKLADILSAARAAGLPEADADREAS